MTDAIKRRGPPSGRLDKELSKVHGKKRTSGDFPPMDCDKRGGCCPAKEMLFKMGLPGLLSEFIHRIGCPFWKGKEGYCDDPGAKAP